MVRADIVYTERPNLKFCEILWVKLEVTGMLPLFISQGGQPRKLARAASAY